MSESSQAGHREREHFFGAAKTVAGMTLLSRVAGMVRASAIASLGANALTDAFSLAWAIPNLFRRLFAEGALSSAFVPVFTQINEEPGGGREKANRLLANSLGILGVFLLALMALVQIGLGVWGAFWPGPPDRQLLIVLTVIMMPFMVTICLLAPASAALNCRGHFLYPASTQVILNAVIILGVLLVAPYCAHDAATQLKVVAASVSAAGLVQLAGVTWFLKRYGFSLRPRLRPVESGIRPMLRLMGPMLIPLGFLQIMELLEKVLGWVLRSEPGSETINLLGLVFPKPLDVGVLPRLDAARNLYQFPMGVFAMSLAVTIFPLLARYAARADMKSFRDSVNRAIRLTFMESLATGTGLFLLAEPISWVLYRHRGFTSADVRQSADILRAYLLGLWAFCSVPVLVRAFYALKDTKTPLKISVVLAPLEVLLLVTLIFVPGVGARAFGLATAAVLALNACALAVLLRRRLGLLGGRKLMASVIRSIVASAAMAAAVCGLQWLLAGGGPWLALRPQPAWVVVAVCVPAGAAVFLAATIALRAPELGELFGALRRKTPQESPPESDKIA